MEMHWLQTIPQWDVLVPKPHTFCDSHALIYSLNTRSLLSHKNDVLSGYNLKTTHIFCLNETHFNTLTSNNTSLNIDTTHSVISVNGRNGIVIIYDNFPTLSSHETFTSLRTKYIVATFNANTSYSYTNNIQTFNIILVNVHNSPSNFFGYNANDNNWQF
jgi:hypothetical protein